jgi:Protein of unknown function (DUF1488)
LSLSFPNQSRSYDARKRCVRFWAHDASFEVPFFVAAEALSRIDPAATADEPGMLGAFDLNRDLIFAAAGRAYARGKRGSYTLSAADMN